MRNTNNQPLYKITYSTGMVSVKCMHFQTEKQFDSWRNKSYAIAKEHYTITIEKRNKPPKGDKIIWQQYSRVYLDE